MRNEWEVIIVGAGPAGLSAALVLGRCRRRVLIVDTDKPRNWASHAVNGFLTRDGLHPRELRRRGREELKQYDSIRLKPLEAKTARRLKNGFQVALSDNSRHRCRKLLLATGVVDELPRLEGFLELYGRSVFHCPYCDGWECRDQPIAVYGRGANAAGLALNMTQWSRDLVVCTDGRRFSATLAARLAGHRIGLRQEPIARLEGTRGQLRRIVFRSGDPIERRFMFFSTGQHHACDLAEKLGCNFTRKGAVQTGTYEVTNIPGLYVAGDASRLVQLAIVAASEGAQAAFSINKALTEENLHL
jgi:thioredoxin reductase